MEATSLTETTRAPDAQIIRFIGRLEKLKNDDDRAALAKLRRSLIDFGRDFSAYTVLGNALPAHAAQRKMELYVLVAGLFAMHPQMREKTSFGSSLRAMRVKLDGNGESSLGLLVAALLNADQEDLPIRLRHIITRLASNEVAVDYARLLHDLLRWESPSRYVQRQWAHDYWVAGAGNTEDADDPADTDITATNAGTTTD